MPQLIGGLAMLRIKHLKVSILTASGEIEFRAEFRAGLNIIRGDNSSGKSTLLSCIAYALGMEELLGGKSETILSYALRDYVELETGKAPIISSSVMLEIENKEKRIVCLRRFIRAQDKGSKLIEVIDGPAISVPGVYATKPTFVHDAGSATSEDYGFYRFLEEFIRFELPHVPSTKGGTVKLYIQTVFAALFIEQKRGWTDYIANIPYFQIRDAFEKVFEFILDMDVFENARRRSELSDAAAKIQTKWAELSYEISLIANRAVLSVDGIPQRASPEFDVTAVRVSKILKEGATPVHEYVAGKRNEVAAIEQERTQTDESGGGQEQEFKELSQAIVEASLSAEALSKDIAINTGSLRNNEKALEEAREDIERNKIARKITKIGGDLGLSSAAGVCPTCHQAVDDTLFLADTLVQPMSLEENIKYLDSQERMLESYVNGTKGLLEKQEGQLRAILDELSSLRRRAVAARRDFVVNDPAVRESLLRRKIQIEDDVDGVVKAEGEIKNVLAQLGVLKEEWQGNLQESAKLPKEYHSKNDLEKIRLFEKEFLAAAKMFGYRSADISEIEINWDTYKPYLAGTVLREINTKVDIKTDSSASDYVRLIWAYLLALYAVSNVRFGNHPGILVLDEPAQHSMSAGSVNALLRKLDQQQGLQSIVAASFDESDELYREETLGLEPNLIRLERKLFFVGGIE